jgi:hypothetical protein
MDAACVATKKWCSAGGDFQPPDVFRLFEGPIALYHRGYVRGVFANTGTIYARPTHCGATQANNVGFK